MVSGDAGKDMVSPKKAEERDSSKEEVSKDEDEEEARPTMVGIGNQEVPLQSMNFQQLQQLHQQLQAEIEGLSKNATNLRAASRRFQTSADSIQQLHDHKLEYEADCIKEGVEDPEPQKILVPLSSSVYVEGRLKKADSLIVDIGTGYYIEKDVKGCKSFLQSKMELLQRNVGEIQGYVSQKERVLEECRAYLQSQAAMAMKAQEQAQAADKQNEMMQI